MMSTFSGHAERKNGDVRSSVPLQTLRSVSRFGCARRRLSLPSGCLICVYPSTARPRSRLAMHLVRRLFVVPLADNDHGKTTMIRALVSQGLGREMQMQRKGERVLVSPHGRDIDSYVFGRSYQE